MAKKRVIEIGKVYPSYDKVNCLVFDSPGIVGYRFFYNDSVYDVLVTLAQEGWEPVSQVIMEVNLGTTSMPRGLPDKPVVGLEYEYILKRII